MAGLIVRVVLASVSLLEEFLEHRRHHVCKNVCFITSSACSAHLQLDPTALSYEHFNLRLACLSCLLGGSAPFMSFSQPAVGKNRLSTFWNRATKFEHPCKSHADLVETQGRFSWPRVWRCADAVLLTTLGKGRGPVHQKPGPYPSDGFWSLWRFLYFIQYI